MKNTTIPTWKKIAWTTMSVLAAGLAGPSAFGEPAGEPAGSATPSAVRPEREAIFEFAQKPQARKEGNAVVITFATTAACDATVAIVGPDGKIVRHLASGVLGPNAPAPFKQGKLAQALAWDGKDNLGRPAPDRCTVRVSLGLKPEQDRTLFQFVRTGAVSALAVDAQGLVYALTMGPRIAVFDRDGAYQRTLLPPPAGLSPERFPLCGWGETIAGAATPLRAREDNVLESSDLINFLVVRQTPAITRDGRLLWVSGGGLKESARAPKHRRLLATDTRDGGMPPESAKLDQGAPGRSAMGLLGNYGVSMTLSPDEQWIYFGSHEGPGTLIAEYIPGTMQWSERQFNPQVAPHHAVYRTPLDNPGMVEPVLGDVKTPGDDNARFNSPRGVAFDARGNLYVADHGNNRIQVFGPAPTHTHLKTIPLEHPDQIAVHPKTGAIYVLCSRYSGAHRARGSETRLVKLGGLENPVVQAELKGRMNGRINDAMNPDKRDATVSGVLIATFALDAASATPALWVLDLGRGVVRFEDTGSEFRESVLLDPDNCGPPEPMVEGGLLLGGGAANNAASLGMYITADRLREEIYIRSAGQKGSVLTRLDGRTGAVIERLKVAGAQDAYMGPDGLLYGRSVRHASDSWLWRYDPDAREFLPFPDYPFDDAHSTGGLPPGPSFDHGDFGIKPHHNQMGVAPNGDLYVVHKASAPTRARLKEAGVDVPDSGMIDLLAVLSPTGKVKTLHALDGFLSHRGRTAFRIGPSGAVYMAHHIQPVGQAVPDGLAGKGSPPNWGSIVKFDSRFDAFPIGKIEQSARIGGATHTASVYHPVRIGNMAWTYGGAGRLTYRGCTCPRSGFEVDRFERVFVPVPVTCSINILDANGNVIARAGQYGNIDNRGRESLVIDPSTRTLRPRLPDDSPDIESPYAHPPLAFLNPHYMGATDEALYVMDTGVRRVVRIALDYAAEETVPLP